MPEREPAFSTPTSLFDVHAAAEQAKDLLGERWQPLAQTWRAKQLQYTWLRSLGQRHADFWQVTGEALDYTLDELDLDDPSLRRRLMELYLRLEAYPEVKDTLFRLKESGLRLAILSNGSPKMLRAAVENAEIDTSLDAILSAEAVGVFKPHPSVYQLAVDRFDLSPEQMCFISSNSWDTATSGKRILRRKVASRCFSNHVGMRSV